MCFFKFSLHLGAWVRVCMWVCRHISACIYIVVEVTTWTHHGDLGTGTHSWGLWCSFKVRVRVCVRARNNSLHVFSYNLLHRGVLHSSLKQNFKNKSQRHTHTHTLICSTRRELAVPKLIISSSALNPKLLLKQRRDELINKWNRWLPDEY